MKFPCTLTSEGNQWVARHESHEWGIVSARAATQQEALQKLQGELRYRLEICPCTGESYQHIDVEVVHKPG